MNNSSFANKGANDHHRNYNYGLAVNTSYKGDQQLNTTNPSGFGSTKEAKSMKNVMNRA